MPTKPHLGEQMLSLMRLFKEWAKDAMPADSLTIGQIQTLGFIAARGKPLMSELAEYLCITAPSTTNLIDGLMRAKLVKRVNDNRDRRAQRLVLTPLGRKARDHFRKTMTSAIEKRLAPLSSREKNDLTNILAHIISL